MFGFFNVDFLWGFCLFAFRSSGVCVCEEEWVWRSGRVLFIFLFLPQKEVTSSCPLWLNSKLSKASRS